MGQLMTIRKATGHEGGFSIIPNEMLNDTLSWEAIGLLAFLCSKPDDWEVNVQHLTNHSGRCKHSTGRDKTYRILEELKQAGYMRKIEKRRGGRFVGVDYIVSPTKLISDPEHLEPILPLTDLPETVIPDTANPTLQKKERNKERKKQIAENKFSAMNALIEKKKKENQKQTYSKKFETFFEHFPKTKGSKFKANEEWEKLTEQEKQTASKSVANYKAHLKNQQWQKPMNPARFLEEKHFDVFSASQSDLKAAESVFINGKGFDHGTVVKLCEAYFRLSEWKYNQLLGPAPDHPETQIPENIIEQARNEAIAGQ